MFYYKSFDRNRNKDSICYKVFGISSCCLNLYQRLEKARVFLIA